MNRPPSRRGPAGRTDGPRRGQVERPGQSLERGVRLGSAGAGLGLTLDVGHLLYTGELPVAQGIDAHSSHPWNGHLDDIRGGEHRPRRFGSGDPDRSTAIKAFPKAGYDGIASVALSRDSHRGPIAATEAIDHLFRALHFDP